jgi:hypothetical protein
MHPGTACLQGVLSLAREVDPDGSRTVGVLTKPDQIEEACHGQWLSVLKGDRYPLKLGYYVVRNPNQVQLLQVRLGQTET